MGDWEKRPAFGGYSRGPEIVSGGDSWQDGDHGQEDAGESAWWEAFVWTIVLSREAEGASGNGALWVSSVSGVLEAVKGIRTEDVFVAGGEEIYRAFLPFCDTAHVTFIDYAYEADAFFPNLDEDPQWVLDLETEEATYFDICYTFRRYVRRDGGSVVGI